MSGNPARAHAAVDRAFAAIHEAQHQPIANDSHVGAVFSVRIATRLTDLGINTIAELCTFTRASLMAGWHIDHRIVDLIEQGLHSHGFALRDNASD